MNSTKVKKVLYDIFIKYQGLLVILVLIDQLTKIWALNSLDTPIKIFNLDWLQFKFIFNEGVAFSMFEDAPLWTKALISLVAFFAIEYYLIFKKNNDKVFNIMLLIIASGAIGNGIDRCLAIFPNATGYKGVVDFIYVSWFANFNVADIYVTVTCFAMIGYIFLSDYFKEKKEKQEKIEKVENNNE